MIDFKNVRPEWHLPPYPPYHKGHYLEEYFLNKYIEEKKMWDDIGRTLIPIYWTTCYLQGINVQPYIDALPRDRKYFTVSQHDDAIKEKLPEDTICFCAGGNSGGVPIPLICSPIPGIKHMDDPTDRDFICTFIGSLTHPVRQKMYDILKWEGMYYFDIKPWTFNINNTEQDKFIDITRRSLYTLCPRGYGAQSFRFYEALQLGSVPIYIHDDNKWLPFEDKINYSSFSIIIHEKNINMLTNIIENIDKNEYYSMYIKGQEIYKEYFTMFTVYYEIYNYLKNYEQK